MHDILLDYGAQPVGSRAWGGETADSDYDYVVDTQENEELKTLLTSMGVGIIGNEDEYDAKNYSYYFTHGGKKYNIIVLSQKSKRCWLEAGKMMPHLQIKMLCDRKLRRYIFTLLVDAFIHLS
jgi:hypothetical protein